jgi:hypothetical protein
LQNHKKVIPFPSLGWHFFDYLEGVNNPIESWYQGLSEAGQDMFDALLKLNQKAERPNDWNGCKMLQGECKEEGIWEWTFFADGCQQRLLGIFGWNRKEAIFLIGCYHKQKVYNPPKCLETAIRRAKEVRQRRAKVYERQVRSNI